MNQIKIGKFIADCRKEKGLTQQELADKIGLTAKAVSKWECGKGMPDVSLYETICAELGITLNEFFAGEHIEANDMIAQSEENLESILKDYYKMKKKKNIVINILLVLLVIITTYFIKPLVGFGFLYLVESWGAETIVRNDISQYDKNYYMETYRGDLDSTLSIFPDVISDTMNVRAFESSFTVGLFDTYGYILLDYTLNENAFEEEINRLNSLEMEIKNYDGESYINEVQYSKDDYFYPAYITIDGYRNTYEYALIDEENNRIICIYLTYLDDSGFTHNEYLKLDRSDYESEDSLQKYSMYSHTFDGGKTYVEFEDYTR